MCAIYEGFVYVREKFLFLSRPNNGSDAFAIDFINKVNFIQNIREMAAKEC